MEEEHEYAAVQTAEEQAALRVQEGEDIDFRIILGFYIVADIIFVLLYIFAKEEGYWVVPIPFLPPHGVDGLESMEATVDQGEEGLNR
eukprot:CAMPEP_0172072948 /NCGR_PEP_ID=MMETSP1043-20130122/14582_1 /TAXON_ID=464988 /ORGANISM="Hemiselmis andersenii, Strain CCMP441" /LENGTH=87 /DNA_ID=CAMNT_0012733439 /DNA_START=143 /DNA_END=402 /DNA_ORIENTATION=+